MKMRQKYIFAEKLETLTDFKEIPVSLISETDEKVDEKDSKWMQVLLWTIFVLTFIGTVAGIPLAYFLGRGKTTESIEV